MKFPPFWLLAVLFVSSAAHATPPSPANEYSVSIANTDKFSVERALAKDMADSGFVKLSTRGNETVYEKRSPELKEALLFHPGASVRLTCFIDEIEGGVRLRGRAEGSDQSYYRFGVRNSQTMRWLRAVLRHVRKTLNGSTQNFTVEQPY